MIPIVVGVSIVDYLYLLLDKLRLQGYFIVKYSRTTRAKVVNRSGNIANGPRPKAQ